MFTATFRGDSNMDARLGRNSKKIGLKGISFTDHLIMTILTMMTFFDRFDLIFGIYGSFKARL